MLKKLFSQATNDRIHWTTLISEKILLALIGIATGFRFARETVNVVNSYAVSVIGSELTQMNHRNPVSLRKL